MYYPTCYLFYATKCYAEKNRYFVHNRTKGYFLPYQNLLCLWQTEFKIPEKDLAAYDWKQKFIKQLPDENKISLKNYAMRQKKSIFEIKAYKTGVPHCVSPTVNPENAFSETAQGKNIFIIICKICIRISFP